MAKSKGSVMVVDDKGIVARDIAKKVKKLGYSVPATAATSEDAVEKAGKHKPDIILMDIKLKSKKDGIETAGEIYQKYNIPAIYLTAYSDEETIERAKKTRPYGYIIKPFEEKELEVNLELAFERLKVEIALKTQYDNFTTILDKYPEYLYVADPETYEVLFANQMLRNLIGRDVVGGTCYKEFQDIDEPCDFCTNDLIMKTRMPHVWEHENERLSRHFLITDQIIQWPDGRDVRFETAIDITDRKKIEKILKDSEYKYNSFIEQSSYGFFIIDTQGQITFMNKKASEISGVDLEMNEKLKFINFIVEEDRKAVNTSLKEIASGNLAEEPNSYRIRKPDGNIRTIEVQTLPIWRDEELTGFHGTILDITDRISFQEKLKEKSEFLDAVVNNTYDGIFVIDEDFNYVFINPASGKIMGHDHEEWIGKRAGTNRHPDDEKKSVEAVFKALNGESATCEIRVKHSGGEYRLLEMRYSLMMIGEAPHILGMVNDITEKKKAEDALIASEEKYRNIFEYSPETIVILDLEGRIMECNQATSKLIELPLDKIIGKRFFELGIIDQIQTNYFINFFKEMVQGDNFENLEVELIMRDGKSKWIETFPSQISKDGRLYAIQLIARDITDRKLAEIEIRNKLMKFEMVPGNLYISKEFRANQSIEAFKELLMVGHSGIMISRRPRKEYQDKIEYMFNHIKISETDKENHVQPSYKAIHDLLSGIPRGEVVHIDCIEYLASRIGSKRTLNIIQYLKDLASSKNQIVLLSVDQEAISEKDMRLIEKESLDIVPSESLSKLPPKLLNTLSYIDELNKEGVMPYYSQIGEHFQLSKPTARARIRQLEQLGTVKEIQRGRKKILELTEKGKSYMVL